MQKAPASRRRGDADRFQLALAIALTAAAVAGGIALGHGPAEAQNVPARQSALVPARSVHPTSDRSLPDAGQALRTVTQDATEPTSTF